MPTVWAISSSRKARAGATTASDLFPTASPSYSRNKEAARDYIRFVHQDDNFERFLVTNEGYINGPLPKWQEHPMWEEDPAITIYRELPQYGRNLGYAGPYSRQSSEVFAKYIIVDSVRPGGARRLHQERHRMGGTRTERCLRGRDLPWLPPS